MLLVEHDLIDTFKTTLAACIDFVSVISRVSNVSKAGIDGGQRSINNDIFSTVTLIFV